MGRELAISDTVRATFIDPMGDELLKALPGIIDIGRFEAALIIAVQKVPQLLKCDALSVRTALLQAATDGLLPDGRRAALVPFWENDKATNKKILKAQYIPMVQGIIGRAKDLGEAFSITAQCVFEKDTFKADLSDPDSTMHEAPQPLGAERGKLIGAYVIFRDQHKRVIHREVMSLKDLERTRAASKASDSPAWKHWTEEMYRKTVIRRGSKYVPMGDALRTIIERDDQHVDFELLERGGQSRADFNPLIEGKAERVDEDRGHNQQDRSERTSKPHDQAHTQDAAGRAEAGQAGETTANATRSEAQRGDNGPADRGTPSAQETQASTAGPGDKPGSADGSQTGDGGPTPDPLPKGWDQSYISALRRATQAKSLKAFAAQFWEKNGGWPPKNADDHTAAGEIYKAFEQHLVGKLDKEGLDAQLRELVGAPQ